MTTITHEKAIELIRQKVKAHGSQIKTAKELDIAPAYLSDILNGRRDVSDSVARKLGYRRVIFFEKLFPSDLAEQVKK